MKGRKEATSKKVGNEKTWLRREMDRGTCSGKGAIVTESERQTSIEGK